MFGSFSASRRISSIRSLLILLRFIILLEQSPDDPDIGGDIGDLEQGSHKLFAGNQLFGLGEAHA